MTSAAPSLGDRSGPHHALQSVAQSTPRAYFTKSWPALNRAFGLNAGLVLSFLRYRSKGAPAHTENGNTWTLVTYGQIMEATGCSRKRVTKAWLTLHETHGVLITKRTRDGWYYRINYEALANLLVGRGKPDWEELQLQVLPPCDSWPDVTKGDIKKSHKGISETDVQYKDRARLEEEEETTTTAQPAFADYPESDADAKCVDSELPGELSQAIAVYERAALDYGCSQSWLDNHEYGVRFNINLFFSSPEIRTRLLAQCGRRAEQRGQNIKELLPAEARHLARALVDAANKFPTAKRPPSIGYVIRRGCEIATQEAHLANRDDETQRKATAALADAEREARELEQRIADGERYAAWEEAQYG